ncbi:Hypothetical_protein [Hexamita inflata]|uniref:Hypothetical_protein n=1 Tax=Hexamita inflata TaxID=28002 RepID=A0AA86UFC8_9EUKA|nr:Hypothetical protein HINF_LOCUS41339 [Hexamita inflata]
MLLRPYGVEIKFSMTQQSFSVIILPDTLVNISGFKTKPLSLEVGCLTPMVFCSTRKVHNVSIVKYNTIECQTIECYNIDKGQRGILNSIYGARLYDCTSGNTLLVIFVRLQLA